MCKVTKVSVAIKNRLFWELALLFLLSFKWNIKWSLTFMFGSCGTPYLTVRVSNVQIFFSGKYLCKSSSICAGLCQQAIITVRHWLGLHYIAWLKRESRSETLWWSIWEMILKQLLRKCVNNERWMWNSWEVNKRQAIALLIVCPGLVELKGRSPMRIDLRWMSQFCNSRPLKYMLPSPHAFSSSCSLFSVYAVCTHECFTLQLQETLKCLLTGQTLEGSRHWQTSSLNVGPSVTPVCVDGQTMHSTFFSLQPKVWMRHGGPAQLES